MEPLAFSINSSGGFSDIVSDQYSFLDQEPDELKAQGNGGMRQMHNYVPLNHSDIITTPKDDFDYKKDKLSGDLTVEQLQKQRDQELSNYGPQQQQRKI
jgi:hypothetical protein